MKSGIQVLHVDDEPGFADLTAQFLERADDRITVQTATNAEEGLEELSGSNFDCLVSDHDMPGKNGIMFLKEVREIYPELPFILFTGKGSEEVASDAISAGVTDYLQKESGTDQYTVLANRITNVTDKRQTEVDLDTRIEQQEFISELGQRALSGADLETVFQSAATGVAEILGNEYAKILNYHDEQETLLLQAGVGWDEGLVGEATVEDDADSQAGHTLTTEEPVIVEYLPNEERFRAPDLLADHDVSSGISVIIGGRDDPWGVFGTHSTRRKTFTEHDATFVQNVANVLTNAIEREERERELEETHELLEETERFADVGGWKIDTDTKNVIWTENLREILGIDDDRGRSLEAALDLFHEDDRPMMEEAVEAALESGTPFDLEGRHIRGSNDEIRWIRVKGIPRVEDGEVVSLRGTVQDITEYREATRAVKESEERLNLALDAAEIGIWELDLQSEESPVRSKQHDRIFGYDDPLDEWDFETACEHVHPDDREYFEQSFEDALTDGTWEFECRIIRADGEERWIAAEGEFFYENDEPTRGIGVVEDITEQKERECRYNGIFNQTYQFTGLMEPNGTLLEANETALEFGDLDREAIIGEKIWDAYWFQHPDGTSKQVRDAVRRAAGGEFVRFDLPIQGAEGERVIDFSIRPIPDDDGEVTFLIPEGLDITDRKESEQELQLFREAVEASGHSIYFTDRNGVIEYVNPAFEEITRYTAEEAVGMTPRLLKSGVHDQEVYERLWETILSGEVWQGELTNTTKTGEQYVINQTIAPIEGESGAITHFVAINRNVTDQKAHQQELQQMNERLDAFASLISHDIRSPLSVASGRLELLKDDCECGSEHLAAIETAHERIDALVSDLLTLAQEGERVTDLKPVALAEELADCWTNIVTKEATLVTDIDRTIRADESRLKQVCENLFCNAIDHGSEDVTVTVGELSDGFYVEDNGPGIPADEHIEVFESGYSTNEGGTGLGLSIVKQIVEAHKWEIQVTEGSDGGARFEITGVEFTA